MSDDRFVKHNPAPDAASEPTILIVPKQGLSAKDKRDLAKVGVIVLEMDDPHQARLIRAHTELDSTDLLGAAASAIGVSTSAETAFGKAVCALLQEAATRKRTSAHEADPASDPTEERDG